MTLTNETSGQLLDRETTNSPRRRTALVTIELAKYNIDIAVLSFHASGSLNDLEYTFYWSGKSKGERREAEAGFAIKRTLWQSWQKCHIQWKKRACRSPATITRLPSLFINQFFHNIKLLQPYDVCHHQPEPFYAPDCYICEH